MTDDTDHLDSRLTEVEARIENLTVLSELALLIHGCLADLFDAIEELGAEVPLDVDDRLERLDQLAHLIIL